MNSSSNNASKTPGRPFEKGNTYGQGRPAGSRNKATLLLEAMIDGEGEELVQTIVTEAKNGNTAYGKALLDRLVPPKKSTPCPVDIPLINDHADFEPVLFKIINDMAAGDITPDEAQAITAVITNHIKLHETRQLEERLTQLENAIGLRNPGTPPAER